MPPEQLAALRSVMESQWADRTGPELSALLNLPAPQPIEPAAQAAPLLLDRLAQPTAEEGREHAGASAGGLEDQSVAGAGAGRFEQMSVSRWWADEASDPRPPVEGIVLRVIRAEPTTYAGR
jgi:hypothetical protein